MLHVVPIFFAFTQTRPTGDRWVEHAGGQIRKKQSGCPFRYLRAVDTKENVERHHKVRRSRIMSASYPSARATLTYVPGSSGPILDVGLYDQVVDVVRWSKCSECFGDLPLNLHISRVRENRGKQM